MSAAEGFSPGNVTPTPEESALLGSAALVAEAAAHLMAQLPIPAGQTGWALVSLFSRPVRVLAATDGAQVRGGDVLPSSWQWTDAVAVASPITVHGEAVGALVGMASGEPAQHLDISMEAVAAAHVLGQLWQAHVGGALAREYALSMERLALTDHLTGLPNRRAWDAGLHREDTRSALQGHDVVVVVVDLDALKPVNDREGHAAGDALIRRAAEALKMTVRTGDVLARIGGDEFGIVAVHCDDQSVDAIRERVARSLADADIQASVGAAMGDPHDGRLTGAWQEADNLMYRAKYDQQRLRSGAT